MAPGNPTARNPPSEDELDDILNGIIDGEDLFDTSNRPPQEEPQAQRKPTNKAANLGIDEEIKIEKKRAPIPKLDEDRLLSAAGIPRLQRISKDRLRFKGKGHEYGDMARMLNMYQLWLDDLYPRAKFADGLAIIEALGHKKRTQVMRKEWIDEGKPKHHADTDPEEEDPATPVETMEKDADRMSGLQSNTTGKDNEAREHTQEESTPRAVESAHVEAEGDPDEDELDALLAESAAPELSAAPTLPQPKTTSADEDMFAEEMEAMEGMEWP